MQNKLIDRFVFLDYLRVIAIFMVMYDHIFAIWPSQNGQTIEFTRAITHYIENPIGIIQNFGFLGVSLFFIVSGFIITHVSSYESPKIFIIRRLFRIYPLLFFSVALTLFINQTNNTPDFENLIKNLLLINYWSSPQVILVGVAWSLVIEIQFYILTYIQLLIKANNRFRILINFIFVNFVIFTSRSFGDDYFLFAASAAYLPFLIFGQIFYSKMHAKAISNTEFLFYIIATYFTALYGIKTIHADFLRIDNSYLINFIVAAMIFTVYYLINDYGLSSSKFITHASSISYSLYLIHGVLGYWMMDIITSITTPFYSAIATTVLIYLFSTLTYNWIEIRFIKFGKNFR